jgi:hypothetical protein
MRKSFVSEPHEGSFELRQVHRLVIAKLESARIASRMPTYPDYPAFIRTLQPYLGYERILPDAKCARRILMKKAYRRSELSLGKGSYLLEPLSSSYWQEAWWVIISSQVGVDPREDQCSNVRPR